MAGLQGTGKGKSCFPLCPPGTESERQNGSICGAVGSAWQGGHCGVRHHRDCQATRSKARVRLCLQGTLAEHLFKSRRLLTLAHLRHEAVSIQ